MIVKKLNNQFLSLALLMLLIGSATFDLRGASGDPDRTFGSGGVAVTSFLNIHPVAVEQQSGGKLLVLCYTGDGSSRRLVLRRHNANGSLDTSFGYQGEAVRSYIPLLNLVQRVYGTPKAVKVQADGKILVAGDTIDPQLAAVLRFTSAGILDTTFGSGNGYVVLGLNVISSSSFDIDISAGKPLLFYQVQKVFSGPGYPFPITKTVSYLARLLSDGSVDPTFGVLGSAYIPYMFVEGSGITVSTASGMIYVFGYSHGSFDNEIYYRSRVFRFLNNGLSDSGFVPVEAPWVFDGSCLSPGGNLSTTSVHYESLVVQSAENFVVSSDSINLGGWVFYQGNTSRFLANGFPDQIFGDTYGGKCEVELDAPSTEPGPFVGGSRTTRVVQQSDGRFIFAGWDSAFPYLKRRFGNGDLDPSFQPSVSLGMGTMLDILIQATDGKIVVLAKFPDHSWNGYKLLRLLP